MSSSTNWGSEFTAGFRALICPVRPLQAGKSRGDHQSNSGHSSSSSSRQPQGNSAPNRPTETRRTVVEKEWINPKFTGYLNTCAEYLEASSKASKRDDPTAHRASGVVERHGHTQNGKNDSSPPLPSWRYVYFATTPTKAPEMGGPQSPEEDELCAELRRKLPFEFPAEERDAQRLRISPREPEDDVDAKYQADWSEDRVGFKMEWPKDLEFHPHFLKWLYVCACEQNDAGHNSIAARIMARLWVGLMAIEGTVNQLKKVSASLDEDEIEFLEKGERRLQFWQSRLHMARLATIQAAEDRGARKMRQELFEYLIIEHLFEHGKDGDKNNWFAGFTENVRRWVDNAQGLRGNPGKVSRYMVETLGEIYGWNEV